MRVAAGGRLRQLVSSPPQVQVRPPDPQTSATDPLYKEQTHRNLLKSQKKEK